MSSSQNVTSWIHLPISRWGGGAVTAFRDMYTIKYEVAGLTATRIRMYGIAPMDKAVLGRITTYVQKDKLELRKLQQPMYRWINCAGKNNNLGTDG
jgi:endonuclease YncB( thermonuclease family)